MSGYALVRNGSISSFWPRADRFRCFPMSGHFQIASACLKGAKADMIAIRTCQPA